MAPYRIIQLTAPPARLLLLPAIVELLTNDESSRLSLYASAGDNFFCGKSWADASSNCDDRQPCPSAFDEECTTPGHVCFGDTLCSVAKGHGEKIKFIALAPLATVDYADVSNTRFCGSWYASAAQECSIETHCPDGRNCKNQNHCFETTCNVQDLVKADLGEDWVEIVTNYVNGGGEEGGASKMSPDDPRRKNFCGLDWGQASMKCNKHCLGNDEPGDCPRGQKCFAKTNCYYDDDLQPTSSPVITMDPTRSPITRDDPSNFSFCGGTWALAIQNCSPETNCMFDRDCKEEGYQCYPSLPGCSLLEMTKNNANQNSEDLDWKDNPSDPRNFRFCGTGWDDAADNCSLDRHCPDYVCSDPGLMCFDHLSLYAGAEFCNAYEIHHGSTRAPTSNSPTETPTPAPTPKSTPSPSKQPTLQPTDPPSTQPTEARTNAPVQIINGLCARSFQHLQQIYLSAQKCSNIDPCVAGQICYPNVDVALVIKSPSKSPSWRPTESPVSSRPTASPLTSRPTVSPFTLITSRPTASPVTKKPSSSPSQQPISPYPTYWYTYPPITNHPAPAGNIIVNAVKERFYCASSFEELEQSCGSALPCDFLTRICPPGQACMQYNECQQTQQKPHLGAEEGNQSKPWDYFPDICPLGFVGMRSPEGDCQNYYDCRDGFRQSSHMCGMGFKFDNSRGECVDQYFFNSTCESTGLEGSNVHGHPKNESKQPQQKPNSVVEEESQSTTSNYLPDLCPLGFVGKRSPEGKCNKYYECADGFLEDADTCRLGKLFDNTSGECVDQQFVNQKCKSIEIEVSNEQNRPNESFGGKNDPSQPEKKPDSGAEEENQSTQSNYFPDLCPSGFVGAHSLEGACHQYYDCNDGLLMDTVMCDLGKLFDNTSEECINQRFINYKCENTKLEGKNNDKKQPSESEGKNNDITQSSSTLGAEEEQQQNDISEGTLQGNYAPNLCPKGLTGLYAGEDCSDYYECNDALLVAVHTCEVGFKFDILRGDCVSQNLVDSNCNDVTPQVGNEQNRPIDSREENNNISQPDSLSENGAKQTNNKQDQVVESGEGGTLSKNDAKQTNKQEQVGETGEGNDNNLQSNTVSENKENEEEKQLVAKPPDNYWPDLCPLGFNGFHAKDDCTKYYECSDGYLGFVHTCISGFKFDKVLVRCISEELVSPYCYGPTLEMDEEQDQDLQIDAHQNLMSPKPSLSPAAVGRPMSSSNKEGGAFNEDSNFVWSDPTATPTAPESDKGFGLWLRKYDDNGARVLRTSVPLIMLALISNIWAIQ